MKKALIFGATGQTGSYLARILLQKGYEVTGVSRSATQDSLWRLKRLGISRDIDIRSADFESLEGISSLLEGVSPDEIYWLPGPSSVGQSFDAPGETIRAIVDPLSVVLEALSAIRFQGSFFHAASVDCFGNQPGTVLTESSPMQPVSPYGVGKTAAYWLTRTYRDSYGLRASNGILGNHESPLRGDGFVTSKLVAGLKAVANGEQDFVYLGNTSIARDWTWAEEIAGGIHRIGSAKTSDDFVLSSGTTHTLKEMVDVACQILELDPAKYIKTDESLFRPHEIASLKLNPSKAGTVHGWQSKKSFSELVEGLIHETL